MNKTSFSTLIMLLSVTCWAQTCAPSDAASSITFKIRHFGLQTEGAFKGLKGSIAINPADISNAFIDVTVDAATIDTGTKMRDNNLRSRDFFDVKQYPNLHFKSVRIDAGKSSGEFVVVGDLVIKGKTKQITFPFRFQQGKDGYQLNGTFSVNRLDFTIGKSSITMADEVVVELSVVVVRQGAL